MAGECGECVFKEEKPHTHSRHYLKATNVQKLLLYGRVSALRTDLMGSNTFTPLQATLKNQKPIWGCKPGVPGSVSVSS